MKLGHKLMVSYNMGSYITTTPVQATINSCILQMSSSTSTTSLKLPPSRKYYLCSQSNGKYTHAAQCAKSRALTKVIDLSLDIESFEKKCVIIKGLLQEELIKQNMVTIGIDTFLSKSAMY